MTDGRAFVARVADELGDVLRPALVGVYLHGSLALGCFNPARSDIDLLVVTRAPLDAEARRNVASLVLRMSTKPFPLELSVLTLDDLHPWRYPTPFDFHFGESHRTELERGVSRRGLDHDLAGHIGLLRERGEVVRGAPIDHVFPAVPPSHFADSILRDLAWIQRADTRAGGRIYGALNACRVLAYASGRGILSKAEAAAWALDELPPHLRPILKQAAAAYRETGDEPCDPEAIRAFVAEVVELVEAGNVTGSAG